MRFNGLTKGFFIFILALVTWAFFDVLSPYFSAILWAAILTTIFNPVKNKLRSALGDRNGLASLITIGIICLIVFIPLMVILSSLAIELNVVYSKLQQNNTQFPEVVTAILSYLPDWARGFLADHHLDNVAQIQQKLSDVALQGGQYLAGSAFLIGKGTFGFAISFGIMLYLLFFLLKDGPYLVRQILDSLPLTDFAKQHLFAKFVGVTRATVKGTAVVAVVQGTLGGIAFAIVERIDGVSLTGACCGFSHCLGARSNFPLCHAAVVARTVYRRILRHYRRAGRQYFAPIAGGQRHQDARLSNFDFYPRRDGDLRYQRVCHWPVDRGTVPCLLESVIRARSRGQRGGDR